MIDRAYKCRLYPNKEQVALIEKTFRACRFVWNLSLETKSAAWKVNKKNLTSFDLNKQLTIWKRTVAPWLYDVSNAALQYSIRDLDAAFKNFYRRVKRGEKPGYPKFKSRHDHNQSFKMPGARDSIKVIDAHHIKLPKLGIVKVRGMPEVQGRILNATVRRVPSGKYFVSLCCTDVPEPEMPQGHIDMLGIDAGVRDLMIRSDGTKVPNNKHLKKSEKKLRREQRRLSRRKKGSKNWEKQRVKVARVHERVANQRRDDLHNATTRAVRDARAIAVENLNVKGMVKNHKLAKDISDASMSEMIRQLEYKCEWYGRDFVKVDRWYPSSKTCGVCGYVYKGLGDKKHWTCPECGTVHDRDLNAARNIAREGARIMGEG